jgi:hypothetical protein
MKRITLEGSSMKVGLFEIPPPGLDPFTASTAELRRYGLPPLPDDPHHRDRYRRVFDHMKHKLNFVAPACKINDRVQGPRRWAVIAGTEEGTSWSGAVVPSPSGSFRWMQGDWVVPNVDAPSGANAKCAIWIGLDGDSQLGDGQQVFQAGILIDVQRNGTSIQATFHAFWEWFPDPSVTITNFAVNPGDLITVVLCSPQGAGSTEGTVFFANRTTGMGTSVGLSAPTNIALAGRTAEWIVETIVTTDNVQIPLADYGEVFFSECEAVTTLGDIVGGGTGNNIVAWSDKDFSVISSGKLITPTIVQCLYTGTIPA